MHDFCYKEIALCQVIYASRFFFYICLILYTVYSLYYVNIKKPLVNIKKPNYNKENKDITHISIELEAGLSSWLIGSDIAMVSISSCCDSGP